MSRMSYGGQENSEVWTGHWGRQVGQDRLLEAVLAFCVLGKWALCQLSLS